MKNTKNVNHLIGHNVFVSRINDDGIVNYQTGYYLVIGGANGVLELIHTNKSDPYYTNKPVFVPLVGSQKFDIVDNGINVRESRLFAAYLANHAVNALGGVIKRQYQEDIYEGIYNSANRINKVFDEIEAEQRFQDFINSLKGVLGKGYRI